MVDWNQIAEHTYVYWQEFLNWFLSLPLYGQHLVIIGSVIIVILAIILVYYILKGVTYLIYYILKGVYLLLKGIFLGFYKLFEELYYDLTGKPKPVKKLKEKDLEAPKKKSQYIQEISKFVDIVPSKIIEPVASKIAYCSECGNLFTNQMHTKLSKNGIVFCIFCGKGYSMSGIEVEE